MPLYAFARPDQMVDHKFTDDVAVCKAKSLEDAKIKFSRLYADIKDDEIWKVNFSNSDTEVAVLTDY